MAAHTNYDDDIFFLQTMVKTLRTGLTLEVDRSLFRDKVIEDLLFVDKTLQRISGSLEASHYLIRRSEYLRDLLRAKRAFADFLDEIIAGSLPFAANLDSVVDALQSARTQHVRDIADIQTAMDREGESGEPQDVVSQDEYRFLLRSDEEDSE